MTKTVYLAGLGLSEGGKYSLKIFDDVNDAKDYVEGFFEDSDDERKWSTEPVIDHTPGKGVSQVGEAMYYGFEKSRKGFIEERAIS